MYLDSQFRHLSCVYVSSEMSLCATFNFLSFSINDDYFSAYATMHMEAM